MITIGITGGTGFIGQRLTALLVNKGYKVVIFTRSASKSTDGNVRYNHWDPDKNECDATGMAELDAIVHLAGAGVAEKRLTEKRKKEIIDSRVKSTDFLLSQLKENSPDCKTFIAASATGYYGPDRKNMSPFRENAQAYNDFLGTTCMQWENATQKANLFARTVIVRIGIVLGKGGGAYPELAGPLSFGVMPILGAGSQVVSWIALDDLARLFVFALENKEMSGIYNGVTGHPVTHRQLMHTIAKVKGGISIPVSVPALLLKVAIGEMSTEVLKSCTVSAEKTMASGFTFDYPEITEAIKHIRQE